MLAHHRRQPGKQLQRVVESTLAVGAVGFVEKVVRIGHRSPQEVSRYFSSEASR
jgi:hypothetical protein